MHGQVISLVAFEEILRLLFRGMHHIILESHWRRDLFLDRSTDAACFRVPTYMIPYFELRFHFSLIVARAGFRKMAAAIPVSIDGSSSQSFAPPRICAPPIVLTCLVS